MLGHSHAMSGLTVGAATIPLAPLHTPASQVAWVVAVGGFAMLPDLDTGGVTSRRGFPRMHGSTIALMWGPVTCLLAGLVAKVAGGHRNGTHSVLGLLVTSVLASAAAAFQPSRLVLLALAIGLALEALAFAIPGKLEELWPVNLVASFAGAWWLLGPGGAAAGHGYPSWMTLAVLVGAATHVAGDMLTKEGVPLAWPVSDARQGLGLFHTGAGVEVYLLAPAFCAAAVWVMVHRWGGDSAVLQALAHRVV
ncbi:MAG: metal-dependent hydrolase [Nocardioides sp.]